jgi:hypothetical protein
MGYTSGDVLTAAELNTFTPSAKIENAVGSAASPSYTFTGDTDTGISAATADTLALSTGGTERVTVASDGQVGIGTTSPGSQLHIIASTYRAFHFNRRQDVATVAVTGGIMQIGDGGDSTNPGTDSYWVQFRRGNGITLGSVKGTGSASVNFATTSDATLKTSNGLVTRERVGSIIDNLQIHDFNWNEGTVTNQIGLFAQEAINILPETIVDAPAIQPATEDEEELYIAATLDYSKIVPILIAECQFLRGRVAALEVAA